ncbi:MAG TPA: CAP domain-containing protein, partial [Tepidisphaeraceae bacterium]|nr:CAP domain-containing protein [Tepidisphaeraceae bacterium]
MNLRTMLIFLLLAAVPVHGQDDDAQRRRDLRADEDAARADVQAVAQQIVERTNAFREQQEQSTLQVNDRLTSAAQSFAEFMARTHEYSHTADGRQPAERATAARYEHAIIAENIAFHFSSRGFETDALAKQMTQGWIDSPGHRKNMLDPDVTEIGVGVARSENGVYYGVQLFGRPKSMQITIRITNRSERLLKYTIDDETFEIDSLIERRHVRARPGVLKFTNLPPGSQTPGRDRQRHWSIGESVNLLIEDLPGGRGVRIVDERPDPS